MSKSEKRSSVKDRHNREDKETNTINFSFCDHKPALESFLLGQDSRELIVEDKVDFWKFVNKYESMLRHVGQPVLSEPLDELLFLHMRPFHKRKFVSLTFSDRYKKATANLNTGSRHLSATKVKQFQEIILMYLDFKQKEKFAKIKKLRRAQKVLPIARYKEDIAKGLQQSRVLIVAGDTGCGKSTQIPQYLYEFGYRNIACTQPRRLACVSLSKRVAQEMLSDYATKVGFQIRFEKSRTSTTNITFITEGLLLRQLAVEANLDHYDVIILDEIHERNLFGDFLLGVMKCLLCARPDLKLILMSATVNVELFYSYFKDDEAKLIEVPGRLYPIEMMFMPPPALELKNQKKGGTSSTGRLDPAPYVQVLNIIDQKYPLTERGDVLIFVSGVNEITTLCDAIREYAEEKANWIILPLHSGLALTEQDKVFDYAPDGMRKCIVSTNIAETSLTVDGIRFVIDSGKVKEMSYDASCKGQRLKEFWVSKSSAEQRKGRAGRTGPGTCFRLYSEKQYSLFEAYPTPEIFRVPLETILLQMISMGLPNVRKFPFIEPPSEESIEQTILALKQHAALSPDEKITALGKALSNLPVDISIGKMLLMGCVFPDIEKILTLAAAMSVQNPFTNRAFTDPKCEHERQSLESDQGDIFTIMNSFREWLLLKVNRENSAKWCHKLGIEEQRFYEICKLRNQFQRILENCNMTATKSDDDNMSSAARRQRHGELRILKAIKRKQKFQEPRKRKVLKVQQYQDDGGDEDNDADGNFNNDEDIRDVDMRLNNDPAKMKILLASSKAEKSRDILLLKLVILRGFYPQIAVADDFNYCKGGGQQFFHTALKPFISIHPNAYFAKYFDILKLSDADILEKPHYYTPKPALSTVHQVLCYQHLLETAKPYLMNCIRMPAAQSLLLFSYTIDTNASVTRVVCDSWLCLDFPTPETGCELLCRAIALRKKWTSLLSKKLDDIANAVDPLKLGTKHSSEEHDLWELLMDFISASVSFTIKRLLPADIKTIYTRTAIGERALLHSNPFDVDYEMSDNEEKGGVNVTENVVYGCLHEEQWTVTMAAMLKEHRWNCKNCGLDMELDTMKKLLHKKTCKISNADVAKDKECTDKGASTSKESRYHCKTCDKRLSLSKIEILKHKKYCCK